MFKKAERKQVQAGDKFGRLTVGRHAGKVGACPRPGWWCACECGSMVAIQQRRLVSGHTKSCGCIQREGNATKHGHRRRAATSTTYISWQSMVQRCIDPDHSNYPAYGGAGITVCDDWLEFESFLRDMGERPSGTSIDRIDGTAGYRPGNCRWSSAVEQANNKYTRKTLAVNGVEHTLREWSEITGIPASCIHKRINKLGWPIEAAVSTPSRGNRRVQEG